METPITSFECDACHKVYRWKPELAGKKVKCKCGRVLLVPAPPPPETTESEDPFAPASSIDDGGPGSSRPGAPVIAAVFLESDSFSFARLNQQVKTLCTVGRSPTDIRFENGMLSFQLGDELIVVAHMPGPYPWSDLEGPCATAWMWPRETPALGLKRHRTHLLVTMISGQSNPVERRLMLTAVTALAAQQPGVMGIYWGDATLVHYPKVFVEMAKAIQSPDAPPLYLWVDYRVFRNPDGSFGLFTTGLKSLGHMEIEIPRIQMPPGELREWTIHISHYLLTNGPVLKDGNTIGMTANQQIRIRHLPSLYGRPDTVLRMGA